MREGWQLESLGTVADFKGGGTPSTEVPDYWNGEIPWVSPKDMKTDQIGSSIDRITLEAVKNSAASIIPTGSILIVVRSGILARTIPTAITTHELTVNQDIKALCPHRGLDGNYLHYFLRSAEKHILSLVTTGATVHRLMTENIKSLQLPLPPLPEQKRIVAILDEAFESIDTATANAKKNLANARELFTRCRDSIFSGRGEGWVTDSLAECLQLITYGFTNPMPSTDSGPYMVTAKNVVGGRIDYTNSRHTSPEAFQNLLSEKSRPKIGDLLLTKDGTLGRLAVVDAAGICVNQSVAVLRPNGRMSVAFMRHLLEAESYQKRMIDDAGGTTIKHIYITRVDKMPVAYPRDPNEQQRIVAQLDEVAFKTDQLKSLYQQKLENLSYLKRSLLQRAFAGNLSKRSIAPAQEAAE